MSAAEHRVPTTVEALRALAPGHEFHTDPISGRISFAFRGTDISDPFLSECGRFTVLPRYYGLSPMAAAKLWAHNLGLPEPWEVEPADRGPSPDAEATPGEPRGPSPDA